MAKRLTSENPESDEEFFQKLASRRKAKQKEREAQMKVSAAGAPPGQETLKALEMTAYGRPDHPIGVRDSHITIASQDWAELIVDAAKKWLRCPGNVSLNGPPFQRDQIGLGTEAGLQIWSLALGGATTEAVADQVDRARQTLGRREGEEPASDSELGLWTFFKQLNRYFDGIGWNPPVIRSTGGPTGPRTGESVESAETSEKPIPAQDSTPVEVSQEAIETDEKPWRKQRSGGLPLRGWAEIADALKTSNDKYFQGRLRRSNDQTQGPIYYVGKIPEVDPGELIAWVEGIAARAEAMRESKQSLEANAREIAERDGARAQDKAMQIRKRAN